MKIKKEIKKFLLAALITTTLFFAACSGARSISGYKPFLSNDYAKSRSTELKVRIPLGWFTALDNENNVIDLWLIKDDHKAVMNLMRLNIDGDAIKETKGYPLLAGVKFSKMYKKASLKIDFEVMGDDEYFDIGENTYGSYLYRNKSGAIARVVVFQYKGKLFELSAIPSPQTDNVTFNSKDLFFIQEAVLSSVE